MNFKYGDKVIVKAKSGEAFFYQGQKGKLIGMRRSPSPNCKDFLYELQLKSGRTIELLENEIELIDD